jgi:hypothetical protein
MEIIKSRKKLAPFLENPLKVWHTAHRQLTDSQTGTIPTILPNMASSDTNNRRMYERNRPSFLFSTQLLLWQTY